MIRDRKRRDSMIVMLLMRVDVRNTPWKYDPRPERYALIGSMADLLVWALTPCAKMDR